MSELSVLLGRLIDDAGQFPPARKPLSQAIDDHQHARHGRHAWIMGRFLCPASTLEVGLPTPVGVVSDGDTRADLGLALAARADAFEVHGADDLEALAAALLRVFVEGADDLGALAAAGVGAKIRCGGERVPADAEVAAFIRECRRLDLPFKATAGLHHAFRTREEHGFVNLLAATALDIDDLEAVIADDDAEAFTLTADGLAWRGRAWDAAAARRLFTAFGSCSVEEPIEDLVAHGVL